MKPKTAFGWSVIILLAMVPVLLWSTLAPEREPFSDYGSITHNLGELAGLVGMTMFALTFLLSTRISFIEDVFGGLDKVYIAHAVLGSSALTLILFHPILLVLKFIPEDTKQAALYLLPSSYWSVNFGIIALIGMVLLIYLALYSKMKYHRWKISHKFLGVVFIFAILHIFMVRGEASGDNIFNGYYVYAAAVSAIGLFGFLYSLFIKERIFQAAVYHISSVRQKSNHTYEVTLAPDHKPIAYKSGQFIFVRFYNEKLSAEAHPFSIASQSNNPEIRIIIKKLGDFTEKIAHLSLGDKVSVEGPYGRFNFYATEGRGQVWIAGGIGITPFIGMAQDLSSHPTVNSITGSGSGPRNPAVSGPIDLYYSAKQTADFVGLHELQDIASKTKKLRVIAWTTQLQGRLRVDDITRISGDLQGKDVFLCGPGPFKHDIMANLIRSGVPKKNIHTEEFDFR